MTGSSLSSASRQRRKRGARNKGLSKTQRQSVARIGAQAGQREIDARAKRKTRQKPGRADVGKKADADLRHREDETLAGHRMRGVHRETNAPAHDDAVHQGDDRFRIGLDPPIELIFLAPEGQLGVMIARAAEVVEAPDVSAGAKGPLARPEEDDPVDGAVPLPFVESGRDQPAP